MFRTIQTLNQSGAVIAIQTTHPLCMFQAKVSIGRINVPLRRFPILSCGHEITEK
jgi:hypothetical protein